MINPSTRREDPADECLRCRHHRCVRDPASAGGHRLGDQASRVLLRYEGEEVGNEEIEPEEAEEEVLEPSSEEHKVTLRITEQWSDRFATNLYTAVSCKDYFLQAGRFTYFYLNPDFVWKLTDRLQWSTGFQSEWTWYDELDSYGEPKDLTSLLAKTELTLRLLDSLKLMPFVQGVFDLYEKEEKAWQTYTAGPGLA
jgi:hypothetical protein